MNDYERKQAARKERLDTASKRVAAKAEAAHKGARRIMDGIPMGQPILVGHHSEKRHRRDIAKIDRGMRKAGELADKAAGLAHAAKAVGTAGISSDDPEAITKLRAELANLHTARGTEKLWNAWMRRAVTNERKWIARELSASDYERLINASAMPESFKKALVSYARAFNRMPQFGTNTQASIARVTKRIAELEAKAVTPARDSLAGRTADAYCVPFLLRENIEENRVQILFQGQPSKDLRERLKRRGFKWAPSAGAWQRMRSNGAWYDATVILGIDRDTAPANVIEADPVIYACPDGQACEDPDCIARADLAQRDLEIDL